MKKPNKAQFNQSILTAALIVLIALPMMNLSLNPRVEAASTGVPQFGHVFLVLEESLAYTDVIGNANMPYLNSLATQYGLATQYYGNTHPSIGNYFMLTTGQIVTNDDTFTATVSVDNVVRQLVAAGKTWKSYAEDLPSVGYIGGNTGNYLERHNPLSYFSDVRNDAIQKNNLVPFTQFAPDLAAGTLPQYGFIIPNKINDLHDPTPPQVADTWLQTNLNPLIQSAAFQQDGLLVIVFDENDGDSTNGGGRVAMVAVSPFAKLHYQSTTLYQHQNLLRLSLSGLGLTTIPGAGATAADMGEFFNPQTPPPPALSSLTLNPTSVVGGNASQGTVNLTAAAPTGGAAVGLLSSNTALATVPASITIPAGSTSATFTVSTSPVAANSSVNITGNYASVNQSAVLALTSAPQAPAAPVLSSVSPSCSGTSPRLTLSWAASANATGYKVYKGGVLLQDAGNVLSLTDTVVSTGTNYSYQVTAYNAVGESAKSNTVSATAPTCTGSIIVNATLDSSAWTGAVSYSILGPATLNGTTVSQTFTNQTPGAWTLSYSSGGPSGASFSNITPSASQTLAAGGAVTFSLNFTTTPLPTLSAVSLNPTSVVGGNTSQGTATLTAAAPAGGAVVTLSSSNTPAAVVPASVTVAQGVTSATFTVTTTGVASATIVTITGASGGAQQTATLTINPPAMSSVSLSPSTVKGGNTSQGTVKLSGIAPAGGAIVTLSSNQTSVATVTGSVTVPAGFKTATFTITTKTVSQTTSVSISGTYLGVRKRATLTVTP
jgi:hypothetical protein